MLVTIAAVCSTLAVPAAAADESTATIAVAPFERRSPPGSVIPDVDELLAERIAALGAKKVVGPVELAVDANAEPDVATIKAWSSKAGVAAVAVGRITRIGQPISIDVKLRSAADGEVLGTYVAEVLKSDELEAAIDDLARQVMAAMQGGAPVSPSAVSAAPASSADRQAFGISFDSERPISIRSDELESMRSSGARKLLFTKNVVVVQDDVTIRSNRLEAFYPKDSSQPDRMIASGSVRMSNPKSEARCDRATYERAKDKLVCRGNAELREGSDCVAGEWIEFDLKSETVKVGGGAKVVIGGSGAGGGGCR
jgi:lipopolysaccharide transport protein LptA